MPQVVENRLALAGGVITQHQIAVWIDDPQLRAGSGAGGLAVGIPLQLITRQLWLFTPQLGVIVAGDGLGTGQTMGSAANITV